MGATCCYCTQSKARHGAVVYVPHLALLSLS
jgi:hypothetical protein